MHERHRNPIRETFDESRPPTGTADYKKKKPEYVRDHVVAKDDRFREALGSDTALVANDEVRQSLRTM